MKKDTNIKQMRNKKGYTQEEIAKLLDISLRYYVRIEQNESEPTIRIGLKLAKILDVNPYELFSL